MRNRVAWSALLTVAALSGCGRTTQVAQSPAPRTVAPVTQSAVPATASPATPTAAPTAMSLVLSGAISATIASGRPGAYSGDATPLGCGSALEDPGHPSFLGTWLTTIGGTNYLFYLNILNYHGPGHYLMSEAGTYLMLRDPQGATATAYFYPAAVVNEAGNFVGNRGEVVVNADQRSGTLSAYLASGIDFQASLAGGTAPATTLTVTGRWSCP